MKKSLKITIISVVAVLVVAAIAVGLYFGIFKNAGKKQAIATVEEMFQEMINVDANTIQKYVTEEEVADEEANEMFDNEALVKAMFKNLSYEIKGAEGSKDSYTVNVTVSNKSFKEVFTNYLTEAIKLAFQQTFGSMTEDEMNAKMEEYFIAQYNSEDITTVTSDVSLNVVKVEGKWDVENSDDLVEAILPGYGEVTESINNMNQQ